MYACEVCLMSTVVYSVDKVLFIVAIVVFAGILLSSSSFLYSIELQSQKIGD